MILNSALLAAQQCGAIKKKKDLFFLIERKCNWKLHVQKTGCFFFYDKKNLV